MFPSRSPGPPLLSASWSERAGLLAGLRVGFGVGFRFGVGFAIAVAVGVGVGVVEGVAAGDPVGAWVDRALALVSDAWVPADPPADAAATPPTAVTAPSPMLAMRIFGCRTVHSLARLTYPATRTLPPH